MTEAEFTSLAMAMPGAAAGGHMGHADFRVGKKIFATLGYPRAGFGMVKLAPEQQAMLMAAEPGIFAPAPGAWGRRGATVVDLARVDTATAESAIRMARERL
jgi:hypothetical protein